MSKKQQAAELLFSGNTPAEIARKLGMRHSDVMMRLHASVGEGRMRRSDLAFSLPRELRAEIDKAVQETGSVSPTRISRHLQSRGVTAHPFDVRVYFDHRRSQVVLGDMYEMVRGIEVRLHQFLRSVFIQQFGDNWWRGGVPDRIRAECAALREKDPEPAPDSYCYTHLLGLRETLDKSWGVVVQYLPKELASNKRELLDRLLRLNRIRNGVMHPVRGDVFSEEEFEFVHDLERDLQQLKVEAHAAQPEQQQPAVLQVSELQDQFAPTTVVEEPVTEPADAETPAPASDFVPTVEAA